MAKKTFYFVEQPSIGTIHCRFNDFYNGRIGGGAYLTGYYERISDINIHQALVPKEVFQYGKLQSDQRIDNIRRDMYIPFVWQKTENHLREMGYIYIWAADVTYDAPMSWD